ncbi:TetR/AcrR family transcriptional regulator [Catenuloplanes atrovinosus]|uniref:AcrR family transcriptional regulator n=1 Tax=Catenuloplanes atrovinosus TaxID=137266 RepID=A0AAE3YPQ7_9ACTN|nr:helix-turn-helix domain-containing protein [Catenuloplanes atrovinosus]MDR7276153.1 AcrR family transcriptional regulator [Catenuloplanes atrovinosus]
MPRPNTDTRAEAMRIAAELFATRGYEQTSLAEIAAHLGITKAALYYHFRSKTDLLRSLVDPLLDDIEALSTDLPADPRATLEAFFDTCYRHRAVLLGLLRDVAVLNELQIVDRIIAFRTRLDAALTDPTPAGRIRAVVALGGIQDSVILFNDDPTLTTTLRTEAVNAALRALNLPT